MKKLISVIIACCMTAGMLAGCSGQRPPAEIATRPVPFEKNGSDGYVVMYFEDDLKYFTAPFNSFTGVARYYHGVDTTDGSGTVMHGSAYNGSDVVFCAESGCSHSDENCLMYYPKGTKFFALDARIYGVHCAEGVLTIYKPVLFQTNEVFAQIKNCFTDSTHSNIATDGTYLYIACRTDSEYVIEQVSLEDASVKRLYTAPEDETDISIQAISKGNVIFTSLNKNIGPTPTTLWAVNIATGESRRLKRVDYMTHVGTKAGVVWKDCYYEMDAEKGSLTSWNFFTGEEKTIAAMGMLPAVEGKNTQPRIAVQFVMDGKAAVQYLWTPDEGGYDYRSIFIDLESGYYHDAKLTAPDSMGDMVAAPVLAQLQGVEIGQYAYTIYDKEGRLAMIAPTDYANGNENYIYITYQ